jgi:hypothetical protein
MTISDTFYRIKFKYFDLFIFSLLFTFFFIPVNTILPHSLLFAISLFIFSIFNISKFSTFVIKYSNILIFFSAFLIFTLMELSVYSLVNFVLLALLIILNFNSNRILLRSRFNSFIFLGFLILLSFLTQVLGSDSRFQLNINDPNFSSLYLLLLLFFFYKIDFKIGYIFIVMYFLLFLSRNFLLSAFIFLFLNFISIIFRSNQFHTFPKFLFFIMANTFVIFLSFYWINYVSIKEFEYLTGIERLLASLNDASNFGRFLNNTRAISYILNNLNTVFFSGLGDFESNIADLGLNQVPHNSLLYLILNFGIVQGFLIIGLLFQIYSKNNNVKNSIILISYITFSLFLHGLFSPFFLIPLTLISKIETKYN